MNDEFLTWCDQHTQDCMAQQRALSADGRGDEARFMQIRANVYGIFPCGEGAGYAGGISSASADGIRCAEALCASILGK